jgi:hypothetical protein
MIAIKPGVRIAGMQTEILLALFVAHELFQEQAQTVTLTSVTDGVHKDGSLHYTGRAVDLRLPTAGKERMVEQLQGRLGAEYDVLLEADHIHVEYDPKRPT